MESFWFCQADICGVSNLVLLDEGWIPKTIEGGGGPAKVSILVLVEAVEFILAVFSPFAGLRYGL